MRAILVLLKKDFLHLLRDPAHLLLTFAVPIVIIYLMGHIFGAMENGGGDGGPTGIRLGIVNESDSELIADLVQTFHDEETFEVWDADKQEDGAWKPYSEARLRELMKQNKIRQAIVFPEDAVPEDGIGLKYKYLYNPVNQMESQLAEGLVKKTLFTRAPRLVIERMMEESGFNDMEKRATFNEELSSVIAEFYDVPQEEVLADMNASPLWGIKDSEGEEEPKADTELDAEGAGSVASTDGEAEEDYIDEAFDMIGDLLVVEEEQVAGEEIKNPGATRSVGGYAIMFLLFTLTGVSTSLFEEIRSGVFLRILSAQTSRAQILFSKYLYNIILGVVQLLTMFVFGWLVFDVDILSNPFSLLIVILATAAASTAFGMFLASICTSSGQASGLGTLIVIIMSAIGGSWFPTFILPETIRFFSNFTITYWAMEAIMKVLWNGLNVLSILPELAVLLLMAAVLIAVSLVFLRKKAMF